MFLTRKPFIIRYPSLIPESSIGKGFCYVCGLVSEFKLSKVINDTLAKEWEISKAIRLAFDGRESRYCTFCNNSLRIRQLAKAIVKVYGERKTKSLKDLVKLDSFRKLKIAEINSCGNLNNILSAHPLVYYSEYKPVGALEHIRNESLEELSYKSNFFNLVLTSDTLEHVPNLEKSFKEIYRILVKGGRHIFTVPAIMGRKTRDRILVEENGPTKKLLSDSFHGSGQEDYKVYREIGGDFLDLLENVGFKTNLYFYNIFGKDYSFVFVSQKTVK